jgi:Ca2+-binding EF-hand superfamily protein
MIERADTDGDGVVSEEEFYNLVTKKSHWFIQHQLISYSY